MFEESTLAQIRERIDIVELVQSYVQLRKSGTGLTGLCPFHKEKTPSFHVHPLKQIYHCFGCHSGGNIFTFLMNVEGLRFPEAVERLAKKAGIEIVRTAKNFTPRPRVQAPEEVRLIEAHEMTANYYHNLLMVGREYEAVRKYVESRGLSVDTVKKFRIGVSPDGWSVVKDNLKKKGFTAEELFSSGLVIASSDGKNDGYDRFRGRLMFPITNADGQCVGFGARLLPGKEGPQGDKQPKYLNSPETPIFSKKNTLYALHENQRGVRLKGEAILVEGYMDVVGLYDKGVDNAMATMGTALTEEHCLRLSKITKRVVTVFDPDEAGREAWRRSIALFLDSGILARDLKLPDARDPDEFVQAEGAEKFYEMVDKAPRQVTQLVKEISGQGAISEEQKAKWLDRLTPILISSRNRPDRALLWDDVSLLLGVSPQTLLAHLDRHMGQKPQENKAQPQRGPSGPQRPPIASFGRKDILGRAFLRAALWFPVEFQKVAAHQFSNEVIEPDVAKLVRGLEMAQTLEERRLFLETVAKEISEPELSGIVSESLLASEENVTLPANLAEEGLAQLVKDLGRRRKEKKVQALTTQVKLAQKLGQEDETRRLLDTLTKARQEEPPAY